MIRNADIPTENNPVRVLYSYAHKIGADRICSTAWEQANSLHAAGAQMIVMPGAVQRGFPCGVEVQPTLSRGRLRIPYSLLGRMRALKLHDLIVARRLEKMVGQIDLVHCWPAASLKTLQTANRLGIPTVIERPNAHTRYAYESVNAECRRMGIVLPPGHEYDYNTEILAREEAEYREAFRILCPSDFVVKTFREQGFPDSALMRHVYGVNVGPFHPDPEPREDQRGLTMLCVGVCAVRKGVHFALEAWLRSPAHQNGKFLIAGEFLPDYALKLKDMLSHPSVEALGHRTDIPELMRRADILVLPSIEEGFGLVCTEAMASGCVPLVSEACTDVCQHMKNSLVHPIGDVDTLARQISMLDADRTLLQRLRQAAVEDVKKVTWTAAGLHLLQVYRQVLAAYKAGSGSTAQYAYHS